MMKKNILRSATLCLVAFLFTLQLGTPAMAAEHGYADVSAESPWYAGIEYVTDHGISNGTGNNCFSPDALITVRQWAVMLCRAYEQAEVLAKDEVDFGTYCSVQAYCNGWISMEAVVDPDQNMCRGALYRSAFNVIGHPIYNYELYPDGVFLYDPENCVRIATELGICTEGTSATELVTRGEAADLIHKIMTQKYAVEEPPIISEYPIINESEVNLSSFLEELKLVPEPIMEKFKARGWKYSVDFDYIADFSRSLGMSVIGACSYGDRCIYVSEASATLHEFGHFLDYAQGWVSKTTSYYIEEAQAADAFMRDYALSNAQEYFADYFVYWLQFHDDPAKAAVMQELTPRTYEYFTNLAANNWGSQ